MEKNIIKLKDVVNRDVSAGEAESLVDYLLACLTHVTNARPLFGVINTRTNVLEWTAGGGDFRDIFQQRAENDSCLNIISLGQLFYCLGISGADLGLLQNHIKCLSADELKYVQQPMTGHLDRCFRVVLRRRRAPNDEQVQFSLLDITPFQEAVSHTQDMAKTLWADLAEPIERAPGARDLLLSVVDGLDELFALSDDEQIKPLAQDLFARVTTVNERMLALLLGFEKRYDTGHWQPDDLDPFLSPVIPVHSVPIKGWGDQHNELLTEHEGEPALIGVDAYSLKQAYDFVQHAASIFVISPTPGCIYVLNGPVGGQRFNSLEDFVLAIDVEENSTQTAIEFFRQLDEKSALGIFAIADQNQEVWGRPGLYGGWQAMLVASSGRGIDVRGLFHGLKNLLLHLQVLYVISSRADVDQVKKELADSGQKIRNRLSDLENIALTGHRQHDFDEETVAQWLSTVRQLNHKEDCDIDVTSSGVDQVSFMAPPGEMEDTLEELVRNAIQHGATAVNVGASLLDGYVCILIQDNGPGMTDDKLKQVRKVLKTGSYDATLSTRKDGTGNGLLAASHAVSNFVDGAFDIDHGPNKQGVEITISMKLPA